MGIGTQLREAREAKGLTLDELQESTKIQKRYLQAIEEENFEVLPGTFYARAFIKEYAGAVGLNAQEMLEEYEDVIPEQTEAQTPQYTHIQRTRNDAGPEKKSAVFSIIPGIIVALLVIGVLFAGWYFLKQNLTDDPADNNIEEPGDNQVYRDKGNNSGDDNQTADDEANNNKNQSEENAENTQDNNEDNTQNTSEADPELDLIQSTAEGGQATSEFDLNDSGETVTVEVETQERTWLTAQGLDEEKFYYDFLAPDDSPLEFEVADKKGIYFKIGNAPDVSIKINDIDLEYPKNPDEHDVQSITINFNNETD